MDRGKSKQQDINKQLNTNVRNQESLTFIMVTMIIIYTSQLRGTLYLTYSVVSACSISTLLLTSALLIRFPLLMVRALGMLRAPSHQSQGLRVFTPLAQCAALCVLFSCTVLPAGDPSGRAGPGNVLQGRHNIIINIIDVKDFNSLHQYLIVYLCLTIHIYLYILNDNNLQ